MKKLILLLLFIPLVSIGQITTQQEQTTDVVVKSNTSVNSFTKVERELVLSDASIDVRVPLADLSSYTDILIVKAVLMNKNYRYDSVFEFHGIKPKSNKKTYKEIENILSMSLFEVKNPFEEKPKKAKKEPDFLKTVKEPTYLYLYFSESSGRGDDTNSTIIIRDYNNKVLYAANHINVGIEEALSPIMF